MCLTVLEARQRDKSQLALGEQLERVLEINQTAISAHPRRRR